MSKSSQGALMIITFMCILCGGTSVAAWGTHVYSCLTSEQWGFLIAGAIAFPIAIVHGVGIWFGVWM